MPVHKTRNTNGRLHQRTPSGGSSKVGLNNLQFTQKDPIQPKQQPHLKRVGQSAVELHPSRNTSPFPRPAHLNNNSRVQSKERISTLQQKRAQAPVTKRSQPQAHKAGFTLSRSSDETDDEEWVSSESGAATPQNDDDDEGTRGTTPVVLRGDHIAGDISENGDHAENGANEPATPRADSELTRVETARPDQVQTRMQPPTVRVQPQSTPTSPAAPTPVEPQEELPIRHTRSEAPSPTQLRQKSASKRHPLIRQTSTYGETKAEMPPHPLIRGPSYHGAVKPAPLAPLTVNSDVAQVQLSASPTSTRIGSRPDSPLYLTQSFSLKSPSEASTEGRDRLPSRKGSISSLHSIATLPAPTSARYVGNRHKQDRTRTLSTMSTSSSSAALSSLNKLPAMSRPGTPPMTVHFPSESRRDIQDGYHQLLPPPYLAAHATVTARYNPLLECYERVMRAKQGR
ncbi:hypothetical protein DFH11DRAFT_414532 [Phellopilus nigrolimitatus]|nr:hypothetical protein DFH11DRAFT_414532 [Phellopilus nigrolimitatus]